MVALEYPARILSEILYQRGKEVQSLEDPYKSTFLKFLKQKTAHRDLLYNYFTDRKKRDEILSSIYSEDPVLLPDETVVPASEVPRNLYSSTFEWYVSELLYREFKFLASAYGVRIKGSPEGGDFDVVGATHSGIVCVECKSGKPRGVDENQLQQFVKRHNFLRADYSILYIDYKGIEGAFPFHYLTRALQLELGDSAIYKVESKSEKTNANFYVVECANIYIVDTANNTGNVIANLRFALDTHHALKSSWNFLRRFDQKLLEQRFLLKMNLLTTN
ncbi:MAG: hypothetical protein ISR65_20435 [Bacteriovoracaceae bacterium]|nr:hypothetical protein [Bacteriovoracaceae bacterium]